jgi:hypothetical protein
MRRPSRERSRRKPRTRRARSWPGRKRGGPSQTKASCVPGLGYVWALAHVDVASACTFHPPSVA